MKGTISMLAAMVLAGGLSVAAVGQAATAEVSAHAGWMAAEGAVMLSAGCKDPRCRQGGSKCHDPACPGCSHCH